MTNMLLAQNDTPTFSCIIIHYILYI